MAVDPKNVAPEDEVPAGQPPEVEDEYQLALEDAEVEDETLLEPVDDAKFTITSYGVDYTVDTLVSRINSEAFFVPQFQRRFVWSQRHASRFIESLLMGLPVPGIFLYKEADNRHMVVDGQQRLRTLQYFHSGLFSERSFRLIGVRKEWLNKTYKELSTSDQLKLMDSVVHTTVFQQDEPKDSLRSLYFVFERINSGGIRLSPQEIRNCINDGPFLDCIRQLNEDPNWRSIFGVRRNTRLKDHELILRFLAMYERHDKYEAPMRDFLNDFAGAYSKANPDQLAKLQEVFRKAIKACFDAKGKAAFRPSKYLNAAVYEGVMLGVADRLSSGKKAPEPAAIAAAYDKLLKDPNFVRATERATAGEESVKTRRNLAVAAFKDA